MFEILCSFSAQANNGSCSLCLNMKKCITNIFYLYYAFRVINCLVTETEYPLVVVNLFFFKSELNKIAQSLPCLMFYKMQVYNCVTFASILRYGCSIIAFLFCL